jgi:hypothetical protein
MKSILAAVAAVAGLAAGANATLVVTQNFNALPTANQTGYFPTPAGTHTAIGFLNSSNQTWYGSKIAGSNNNAMSLFADAGAGNGGGIYSYALAADPSERALGTVASGTSIPAYGVAIVNTTTDVLTSFTLTFDSEMYRSSTTQQNTITFGYGYSSLGITASNFLTSTAMLANTNGNVVGQAPVTTNGPSYALLSNNSVVVSGISVAPGESFFFRWVDQDNTGADAGLAIDNFSFTAIPTPGSVALVAIGGLVAVRRRRA